MRPGTKSVDTASILHDFGILLGQQITLEDNCCAVKVRDVVINMQCDEINRRIVVSAYLSTLPHPVPQALLEQLLIGNLYWQAGATICLEPGTRSLLMLHPECVNGLTGQRLLKVLQQFAESVDECRKRLAAYRKQ